MVSTHCLRRNTTKGLVKAFLVSILLLNLLDSAFAGYNKNYNYNNYNNYNNNYNSANNQGDDYNSCGGNYNGNNGNNNGDDSYDPSVMPVENCQTALIQVTEATIVCDTPYQNSYKSGAHQHSALCGYGDYARVTVYFTVGSDVLSQNGETIYMDLAIVARKCGNEEKVYHLKSTDLCSEFVGHDCNAAGNYAFSFATDSLSSNNYYNSFYPVLELAFSNRKDQGYNLGGININCQYSEEYPVYGSNTKRRRGNNSSSSNFIHKAAKFLGMMIVALGVSFVAFSIAKRHRSGIEYKGRGSSEEEEHPETDFVEATEEWSKTVS